MNAKWMLHPVTNMVMAFNEQLVREDGYRPYNGPLPVIDPELGFRVMHDDVEFETEQSTVEREKTEKAQAVFNKHKVKIFEALCNEMRPIDFVTANGMPKLKTIEKIVGFMPSLDERKAAFEMYEDWKATQSQDLAPEAEEKE